MNVLLTVFVTLLTVLIVLISVGVGFVLGVNRKSNVVEDDD